MNQNNEEIPQNLRPSESVRETGYIEEVVSPVQPHKPTFNPKLIGKVLFALLAVVLIGYGLIAQRSAMQLPVKVANAPESMSGGLQMPAEAVNVFGQTLPGVVVGQSQPGLVLPPQVIDQTAPIPRISSTITNEPNIAAKPTSLGKVAGANVQVTPAYTYTSAHGFSFRVPAGATVKEVEQGRVVVQNAKGQVLGEVVVLPQSSQLTNGIPSELALSSSVSNVHVGAISGSPAYLYTINGTAKGGSVTQGASTYYITDFSGKILPTFTLR
jgi:hypothetical protein